MVSGVRIYADFQKVDDEGRLILTCRGTVDDMARHGITPTEGLSLLFYADDAGPDGRPDDLLVDGVVEFDHDSGHWTARIDWNAIRHESDETGPSKS